MKSTLLALLVPLLSAAPAQAEISFANLPAATTAKDATDKLADRRDLILSAMVTRPITQVPTPPKERLDEFAEALLARMIKRQDLPAVSATLMKATAWDVGTSISLLGSYCHRVGDYDFVLQPLLKMAYLDEQQPMLTAQARFRLRNVLLNQRGITHHITFKLDSCLPVQVTDSENHILMSEVSRYLTNQLLFEDSVQTGHPNPLYNNAANGFDAWMLDHLSEWLRRDFNELNSKPYQGYTWIALENLFSYARNNSVRTKAQLVLDYISAKTALQSIGLRRHPPYRRQLEHRDDNRLNEVDTVMDIYSILTGAYSYLELQTPSLMYRGNEYVATMAAAATYEVPAPIMDLFVEHDRPTYIRMKHRDVEIYAGSKHFLLSAGGRYRTQLLSNENQGGIPFTNSRLNWLTSPNDQWAVSTTVIPAHYGLNQSELFRIDGALNWNKKNNLCVVPGFACGENLFVPILPKGSIVLTHGAWTFYDVSRSMGFFVAAYREPKTSFAMIEVREPTLAFKDFAAKTLALNPAMHLVADFVSQYHTSTGHTIGFTPNSGYVGISPIRSFDGHALEADSAKWPLAAGNVMRSSGDGLIEITSPTSGSRLTLDDRDPRHPRRQVQ